MKKRQLPKRIILVCTTMSIAFLLSMFLTYMIPDVLLEKKVAISAKDIVSEGAYLIKGKHLCSQLDNYTEAYMLNMAIHQDGKPYKSAILNPYYENEKVETNPSHERLVSVIEGIGKEANASYGRYWQGSLVFLRPLLIFFTLKQIYIINEIVLYGLIALAVYLLSKRSGLHTGLALLLCLAAISVWYVPLSTKFLPSFIIALGGIIYFCLDKKNLDIKDTTISFVVIGGLAAFFDFFSTPLVTLGLPLLSLLMIHNEKIERFKFKEALKIVTLFIVGWLVGWLSLLFVKATIYVLLSSNHLEALSGITIRMNNWMGNKRFKSLGISRLSGVRESLIVFLPNIKPLMSIIVLFILIEIPVILKKNSNITRLCALVFVLTFVWWTIFATSVHQHAWAVYRTIVISLFAMCCSYINLFKKRQ